MSDRSQLAEAMLGLHEEIETEKNKARPNSGYLVRLLATGIQQCLAAHVVYLTADLPKEDPNQLSLFPDIPEA